MLYITSFLLFTLAACGGDEPTNEAVTDVSALDFLLEEPTENPYLQKFDSMPPGGRKLKVNIKGYLARMFRDSNYRHLQAAGALGFSPIDSPADAWNLSRPVSEITTCRYYYVDELTHSLPFLVPEAKTLLEDIGRTFIDTLRARGGGYYRIKVTSVLRTNSSVARLRRRNRNAVDSSAHCFGTTFDVSYAKFICDSVNIPRTQEDLKNLLGEILNDFKEKGRCYVKYERKQGCFHITARPVTL